MPTLTTLILRSGGSPSQNKSGKKKILKGIQIEKEGAKSYLLTNNTILNIEISNESEVTQSCLTLCEPMDCNLAGSSVHRIF